MAASNKSRDHDPLTGADTVAGGNGSGGRPSAPGGSAVASGRFPDTQPTTQDLPAAERVAGVGYTRPERDLLAEFVAEELPDLHKRVGALALENHDAPAEVFRVAPAGGNGPGGVVTVAAANPEAAEDGTPALGAVPSPPTNDEDLAFAPAWQQSAWIANGAIRAQELVALYRARLERYAPTLLCMATGCFDRAAAEAAAVDTPAAGAGQDSIAEGGPAIRCPLVGTVWGAKDLLDTNGIETAWGAEPFQGRVPDKDAHVVARLRSAGTALIAKLSLGALAYGDIWYAGRTQNPWNKERGSSGSSAGPASATAAGLVSFALGTETMGSIVSPSMECGTTGLRPTFGLVGRSGAMALSWSFDKIGPIARTVRDAGLVLEAIAGPDLDDPSSVASGFVYRPWRELSSMRVGYDPRWFDHSSANDLDRSIPGHLKELGTSIHEFTLPELDYQLLAILLQVDAAAAFEELTRTNRDDELSWQSKDAWPSRFRGLRFVSAVEYVQLQRFRRRVGQVMDEVYHDVDVIASPSFVGPMLFVTNATGHPSLTLRVGFKEEGLPHGITLYGRHFNENTLLGLGEALEGKLCVWDKRPPL